MPKDLPLQSVCQIDLGSHSHNATKCSFTAHILHLTFSPMSSIQNFTQIRKPTISRLVSSVRVASEISQ